MITNSKAWLIGVALLGSAGLVSAKDLATLQAVTAQLANCPAAATAANAYKGVVIPAGVVAAVIGQKDVAKLAANDKQMYDHATAVGKQLNLCASALQARQQQINPWLPVLGQNPQAITPDTAKALMANEAAYTKGLESMAYVMSQEHTRKLFAGRLHHQATGK